MRSFPDGTYRTRSPTLEEYQYTLTVRLASIPPAFIPRVHPNSGLLRNSPNLLYKILPSVAASSRFHVTPSAFSAMIATFGKPDREEQVEDP